MIYALLLVVILSLSIFFQGVLDFSALPNTPGDNIKRHSGSKQAFKHLSVEDLEDEVKYLEAQQQIGAHRAVRHSAMQLFWFRHLPKHDEPSFELYWSHFPRDYDRSPSSSPPSSSPAWLADCLLP